MRRVNPAPSLPLAEATIRLRPDTVRALLQGRLPKGNALAAARAAAMRAARSAGALLPLAGPGPGPALEVEFEVRKASITIMASATGPGAEQRRSAEEALAAVGAAALAIYDVCKSVDREMTIGGVRVRPAPAPAKATAKAATAAGARARPASRRPTARAPRCGVIVLSDSTARGEREDRSGRLLREGLRAAGARVEHFAILPDEVRGLRRTLRAWVREGVQLVFTSGGTGLGPRDITIAAVEPLLDTRLPGIEQALHAHGRAQVKTAMLSGVVAGTLGRSLVMCLRGSAGAARDALQVLVPDVFHAFDMMAGQGHD